MSSFSESKIEAQTSPARLKARIGKDVTLWCNATGYPKPIVYWTREDRNRKLPDGSYQFWVRHLPYSKSWLLKAAGQEPVPSNSQVLLINHCHLLKDRNRGRNANLKMNKIRIHNAPLELKGAKLPLNQVSIQHLLTPRGRLLPCDDRMAGENTPYKLSEETFITVL